MEPVRAGTVGAVAQLRSTGGRRCARPGCAASADATLTFSYQERAAWLRPLAPTRLPQAYDLCPVHAERTRPPRGWGLSDERAGRTHQAVAAAVRDLHPAATGPGRAAPARPRAVAAPPRGFDHDRAVSVLARVLGADRFPPPADVPRADVPGADAPGADVPGADAPGAEGPERPAVAPLAPPTPGSEPVAATQLPLSLPTARPDLRPDPRAPVPDRPPGPARSW